MEQSEWVDLSIIALISISTIIGVYRGFIREILTLLTWILAGYLALLYGQDVGDLFDVSKSGSINYWLGVAIIFASIVIVGFFIKIFICSVFKIKGTKIFDRFAGAIFGALRGSVVVILVLVAASDTLSEQTWYKNSSLINNFQIAADIVIKNMPKDWREELKQDVKELQDTIIEDQDPEAAKESK